MHRRKNKMIFSYNGQFLKRTIKEHKYLCLMKILKTKNPFLLFLPFLILYITLVFIFPTSGAAGDENRYLMFANNLIHGFYSPSALNIDLGNSPGYPIILMPFIALHFPLICIALLNAVLYYLSTVSYTHLTLPTNREV